MKFNIAPQDLQGMISKLLSFASQIEGISNSMRSYSNQLSSSWKDPQYVGFIDQISATSKQMATTQQRLRDTAQNLKILKQNLEKAHADYKRLR